MARFPKREADIRTLVQNIIAGLTGNPDFPNPPFTPAQLQAFLDNVTALEDSQVAAQAAAQQATEAKQAGIDEMVSAAKSVLSYAENAVSGNDAKLAALGWGGRAAFYRVERRKAAGGEWAMAGTALEAEITLNSQERGKEWEYRVIAVNKAGESEASNTVTVVL